MKDHGDVAQGVIELGLHDHQEQEKGESCSPRPQHRRDRHAHARARTPPTPREGHQDQRDKEDAEPALCTIERAYAFGADRYRQSVPALVPAEEEPRQPQWQQERGSDEDPAAEGAFQASARKGEEHVPDGDPEAGMQEVPDREQGRLGRARTALAFQSQKACGDQ